MGEIKIQCKIWLEKDEEVLFGRGRLELLRGIREYGSLAETARHLGMSYRAAWVVAATTGEADSFSGNGAIDYFAVRRAFWIGSAVLSG